MSNWVPRALCKDFQKLEANRGSRSEIIETGTPCRETTSLRYNRARRSRPSVSLIARKCADFVNRSTITQIMSQPLGDFGSLVTKSIVICSHFHSGISGCCRRPDGFWYSTLTLAQVRHLLTYEAMSAFMLGHQYSIF